LRLAGVSICNRTAAGQKLELQKEKQDGQLRRLGESDESSTSLLVVVRAVANCTLWRMISHATSILIFIILLYVQKTYLNMLGIGRS
jgi:hypothetical protein